MDACSSVAAVFKFVEYPKSSTEAFAPRAVRSFAKAACASAASPRAVNGMPTSKVSTTSDVCAVAVTETEMPYGKAVVWALAVRGAATTAAAKNKPNFHTMKHLTSAQATM